MPTTRSSVLILFLVGAVSVRADQTILIPNLPNRPAAVTASYRGVPCPVVAIRNGRPLVEVEGRTRPADSEALSLAVGSGYAQGSVTLSEADLTRAVDYRSGRGSTIFKITIESQTALADAFLVLFVADYQDYTDALEHDRPIVFTTVPFDLGRLDAGKRQPVSMKFGLIAREEGHLCIWSAVIFSRGQQVRSAGVTDTLPLFFDAMDRDNHRLLKAEREKRGEAAFEVFRAVPLDPPPEIKAKYGGQKVNVTLQINRNGNVTGMIIPGNDDPALADFVRSLLTRWWLFLPPVHNGAAYGLTLSLPLRF